MPLFENNLSPYLTIVETATGGVAAPSAGQQRVAIDPTSHLLYWKDSSSVLHTAVANPMTAANDLIIGGTSGAPTRLATVASKVLVTDGSGVISWGTASGVTLVGSGLVLTGGDTTSTSATFADVTGASITLTTGAHRVRIVASGTVQAPAGGYIALDLDIDGTRVGNVTLGLALCGNGVGGNDFPFTISHLSGVLTAASHTFKLQLARITAGTATVFASNPALLFNAEETSIAT